LTDFHSFASSSLEGIYGKEKLDNSIQFEANYFSNAFLINNGSSFELVPGHKFSQLGPILDAVVGDFNKDDLNDILSVGAIQSTEPVTRAYSGNKGIMFLNNKSDIPYAEYKVTRR